MRFITTKILSITPLKGDVSTIELLKPEGFSFKAGQYIQLSTPEAPDEKRFYSLASTPHEKNLKLHVKDVHMADSFSTFLCNPNHIGRSLLLAPRAMGEMTLEIPPFSKTPTPLIFLCAGTGFAPVWSLLKTLEKNEITNTPISVYWGLDTPDMMYIDALFELDKIFTNLTLTFCFQTGEIKPYKTYHGFVGDALKDDFSDLNGYKIFIAGPPAMAEHTISSISTKNLDQTEIYCDYSFLMKDLNYLNKPIS